MNVADLVLLVPRMRESRVDSVSIHETGGDRPQIIVRLTGRWGCTTFGDLGAFNHWLQTGELPAGAQTKFAEFNPRLPN